MLRRPKNFLVPAVAAFLALSLGFTLLAAPASSQAPSAQATPEAALDELVQRGQLTPGDAGVLSALLAKDRSGFTPQERDALQGVIGRLGSSAATPASPVAVPQLPPGPTLLPEAPCSQCVRELVKCVVQCITQFVDCLLNGPIAQCIQQLFACIQECLTVFFDCLSGCTPPLADVRRQADLLGRVSLAEGVAVA